MRRFYELSFPVFFLGQQLPYRWLRPGASALTSRGLLQAGSPFAPRSRLTRATSARPRPRPHSFFDPCVPVPFPVKRL